MQYAQRLKMRAKIYKSNSMNYSCHGSDAGKDFSTFIDVFLMDMIKYSQGFVADRFIEVSALSNAKKSSKNRSILWST